MNEYLTEEKRAAIKECRRFDEILDVQFGPIGSPNRDRIEYETELFILSERLKAARLEAGMTQEQLATKIGTKKSYISRIENGKADVQLTTLFKIFEGLGKRISVTVL